MRSNNKVLLENTNDYLEHIGAVPEQIEDVKKALKKDMKKSDEKDVDYAEYRHKSHAEILQIIERNLVIVSYNPIIFYTLNFLLFAYLFDKKLIPFSAVTGLYFTYFIFILIVSMIIYATIKNNSYLYRNQKLILMNIFLFTLGIVLCLLKVFNITLGVHLVPMEIFHVMFTIGVLLCFVSIFIKKPEVTAMGLIVIQKTIASITQNETIIMTVTFVSWFIIMLIIIYFVMRYSNKRSL